MSDTPVSTTTSVTTTENETVTLANEIKKYKTTAELITFLQGKDLGLSEKVFEILEKEEVNGRSFLRLTEEKLRSVGLGLGPATTLVDFAKECEKKKLRSFSSYLSLSEMLAEYGIESDGIDSIPVFTPPPQTREIRDDNKFLNHCVEDILLRLGSYGTLQPDSLEAMRNEYVVALLHAAIHIVMDETNKELSMRPQYEIIGNGSKGRVDYAIRGPEDLICITEDKPHQVRIGFAQNIKQLENAYERNRRKRKRDDDDFDYLYGIVTTGRDWHFLLYSPGKISKADTAYLIEITKKALDTDSEEHTNLRKNVKKVLGVIVGLLKDRACVEDEPESKRAKIEGYQGKK